jgi:hypothetical protein
VDLVNLKHFFKNDWEGGGGYPMPATCGNNHVLDFFLCWWCYVLR